MGKAPSSITLKEWLEILDCYLERMRQPGKTDKDIDTIEDWFAQATSDVLRTPVRCLDDLVVKAAVAVHWNSPINSDAFPYPQHIIDGYHPGQALDRRSLAYLVKDILDLAGVKLDNEGRLLQLS
jgi:hypothetical protein